MPITFPKRWLTAVSLCLLVVIAQVVGLVLIGFQAHRNLTDASIGWLMRLRSEIAYATIFHGTLVYPLQLRSGQTVLRSVSLKDGHIGRDIVVPDEIYSNLITDGKQLWAIGFRKTFVTDGKSSSMPLYQRPLGRAIRRPFLWEGLPAVIEIDAIGNAHLLVLIDGDWKDKGQFGIPGPGRTWQLDEQTGESTLLSRNPNAVPQASAPPCYVFVARVRGQYHLFQVELLSPQTRICHRGGFDFIDAPVEGQAVSALAPENAPAEATQWRLIASDLDTADTQFVVANNEFLLSAVDELFRIRIDEARSDRAKFEPLKLDHDPLPPEEDFGQLDASIPHAIRRGRLVVVSDPDTRDVYVVTATRTAEIDVYRLEGNQLIKLNIHLEGWGVPLLRLVTGIVCQVVAVLIAGTLLLSAGAAWLSPKVTYTMGLTSAELAPLGRRSLARGLDLALSLAPLVIQLAWLISRVSGESLFLLFGIAIMQTQVLMTYLPLLFPAMLWTVTMPIVFVVTTGLWGTTPGKWLFHIRVVRTTFRPCGIRRALLREIMLWFDVPLLLTTVPGLLFLVGTENRQRIGDLLAGTIAIDSRSERAVKTRMA